MALLPVPFFVLFILAELQFVRRLDELKQRMHLEALAIAFPATFFGFLVAQFLEGAGFLPEGVVEEIWPLMVVPYAVSYLFLWRRYR